MSTTSFVTKQKTKSIFYFILILLTSFFTLFAFSACKLTNDETGGDASFDASGRLRIVAPYVEFNKYSSVYNAVKGTTELLVDDNSGSLSWVLQYYYTGKSDINYDQEYAFANWYTSSDCSSDNISPIKPEDGGYTSGYFYNGEDRLYTPAQFVDVGSIAYPSYEVIVDGKYYTFQVSVNKNLLSRLSNDQISNLLFSGENGTKDRSLANIFRDESYDYENNTWVDDDAEVGSLFTFKYRTGKNNNGEFVDCPAGMMTYYVDPVTCEFKVRFNPQLEAGSTNRYVKVRALADDATGRADSIYSSTVTFEAYALSFEVYSVNSSTLDYGGLHYDSDKYYFSYKKTYYDEFMGTTQIKSLTGYFPEGRKVVVERYVPYFGDGVVDYNYAMQNWTTNATAENSTALYHMFPTKVNQYNYGSKKYGNNVTSISLNLLSEDTIAKSDAFGVLSTNKNQKTTFEYKEKTAVTADDISSLVYDYSSGELLKVYDRYYSDGSTKEIQGLYDQLVVASHSAVNGYKFYGNYAKVRGFTASGTFFNGDKFFTSESQELKGVTIQLFFKIGSEYTNLSLSCEDGTTTFLHESLYGEDKAPEYANRHPDGITVTIDGAYFKVDGLEYDDFLIFQKDAQSPSGSDNKPFAFHSALLSEHVAFGTTLKGLDLVISDTYYSDRQDIGIIATQYEENSNLIVNIYRLKDTKNGTTESVPSTYLDLLKDTDISYEIIKSVSSVEDDDGYITTNIIISIILPSDASLTGYNVETLSKTTKKYYSTNETAPYNGTLFVEFLKYDAQTMKNKFADKDGEFISDGSACLYEILKTSISKSSISETGNSSIYYYDSKIYTYDYKETGGYLAGGNTTAKLYYYKNTDPQKEDSEPDYIIKQVVGGNESWFTLKYASVGSDKFKYEITPGSTDVVYKYNDAPLYALSTAGDIYRVSTIANAYKTEMKHTKTLNEQKQTQAVYVYYDVKAVGDNYYYIAPIGRQDKIVSKNSTTGEQTIESKDVLYFEEISNFTSLKGSKIKLGSEIMASNDALSKAFYQAIGSKLILNCYYYIKELEQPVELYFQQYINEEEVSEETQTVIEFYYEGGSKYSGATENIGTTKSYYAELMLLDSSGIKIATSSAKFNGFSNLSNTSTLGLGGNLDNYLNQNTHEQKDLTFADSFMYNGTTFENQGSGLFKVAGDTKSYKLASNYVLSGNGRDDKLNIQHIVTLYEFNIVDGSLVPTTTMLYFDGTHYYRIIGYASVQFQITIDGDGKEETSTQSGTFAIYDTTELAITTQSSLKTSNVNYYNALKVTSITGVGSVTGTYETRTATEGANGIATKTINTTYYKYYLVNSFASYDDEGNFIEYYYATVKDGSTDSLVYSYTPSTSFSTLYSSSIMGKPLFVAEKQVKVYLQKTALVRSAQLATKNDKGEVISDGSQVTVLGKYIITNDQTGPKIYPSFSSLNTYDTDDAYILDKNDEGETNYYSLDYTTKKNAIEGFPGITLLAGIPYPNPVLSFQVRHKASETPVVNIALDINNAYYVEVIGTNIATDSSNLIQDFTTYSFKDTLENLTQNDYIDKAYWLLDKSNFNPIYALVETESGDNKYDVIINNKKYSYYMYTTSLDENGNEVRTPSPLTLQNVQMNDKEEDFLYANTVVGVNGKYYKHLYMKSGSTVEELKTSNVLLWDTSATTLNGVPTYDIHSYTQGLDGIIYFNSGSSYDDNIICNGLSGITAGATNNKYGVYNYDEVMISGVTYAYRTLASQVNNSSNMSGYQFDKMINILNAYDSNDAFFLTGKESAILVASPVVKLNSTDGNDYVYVFKEWKVYSRYNSEVLYYNRGVTENLSDRTNAILRFTSYEAGYYVMFPVYERVFSIDTGSAVLEGAINQGGGVDIAYKDGYEVDAENTRDDNLYFVNYFKTEYQGKEGYYYGNLKGYPYVYFTGTFDASTGKPIFQKLSNLFVVNAEIEYSTTYMTYKTTVPLFFKMTDKGSTITFIKILSGSLEEGTEGLILLDNQNGQYGAKYLDDDIYINEDDEVYVGTGKTEKFYNVLGSAFTSTFFYDEITNESSQTSVPLYYNSTTKIFSAIEINKLGDNFKKNLISWNAHNNSFIFSNKVFLNMGDESTPSTMNCGKTIQSLLGDDVAESVVNVFSVVDKVENPYVNGLYVSRLGSLLSGELVKDEEGNRYSTQQFKTAYITRDSYVELQAIADIGYRFEGWYKCVYNEESNFWYTTDEKFTNSENIYSDEIIQSYYNPITKDYYYITEHFVEEQYDSVGKVRRYYYDEDFEEPAIVPDRMLSKVRGFFINIGTNTKKNYVQVYLKTAGLFDKEYYYEANFINKVDTSRYDVEELAYSLESGAIYKSGEFYYLGNVGIYCKEETDGSMRFYRHMETGNIVADGDILKINKLHSNIRFVAKFVETYNEYIFAEDEDSSGISIQAVYYSNSKNRVDEDGNTIIRTNALGENMTAGKDVETVDTYVSSMDRTLFALYDDDSRGENLTTTQKAGKYESITWKYTGSAPEKTVSNSYTVLNQLVRTGFGSNNSTYLVNTEDPSLNGKLNLNSMYFDVDTTVHIVVRVKADYELSIHTLGTNSKYTLYPIFGPTDEYVQENQKATKENKVDYLYYIFKVTYNRDPMNEYRQYIVHSDRSNNMSYDALVGNNINYYGKFFNYYCSYIDSKGIERETKIEYEVNKNTNKVRLTRNFVKTVTGSTSAYSGLYYDNFEKALYELCKTIKAPGTIYCKSIALKKSINQSGYEFDAGVHLTQTDSYYDDDENLIPGIFDVLKGIFASQTNGTDRPFAIRSGQRNFINLSTIPIYNYTVQAVVVTNEGDTIQYDPDTHHVILPLDNTETGLKLATSVYVSGGMNGKDYLGEYDTDISPDLGDSSFIYKNYYDIDGNTYQTFTTMEFKKKYSGMEYATPTGATSPDQRLFEDLAFVENTIILFQGIGRYDTEEDEGTERYGKLTSPEGYLFAGWYEQKYNRETGDWSDLVFMSSDEETPYLSLALADTVVFAVYKRAVEATFTYNEREMTVELGNGMIDSAGNALTIEKDDNTGEVKLTGTFFFDASIDAVVAPAGGYRFNGISYTAYNDDGAEISGDSSTSPTSAFTYANYNPDYDSTKENSKMFISCSYANAILNGILKINLNLYEVSHNLKGKAINSHKIDYKIETKKLTLAYAMLDNYYINEVSESGTITGKTYSGFSISWRDSSGSILKDSTHSQISSSVDGNSYIIYGWFDNDKTDLVLVTYQSFGSYRVDGWNINGNNQLATMDIPSLSASGYSSYYNALAVKFQYEGDLEAYNSEFSLNKDNAVYYAHATVEQGSNSLTISHRIVESVSDLSKGTSGSVPYASDITTTLNFTGTLKYVTLPEGMTGTGTEGETGTEGGTGTGTEEGSGEGTGEGSGEEGNKEPDLTVKGNMLQLSGQNLRIEFTADPSARINLSTDKDYIIVNGHLYIFIGWFRMSSATSQTATLISQSQSVSTLVPDYFYEARYVRATVFDMTSSSNITTSISSTQAIYTLSTTNGASNVLMIHRYLNGVSYSNGSISQSAGGYVEVALCGSTLSFEATPRTGYMISACTATGYSNGDVSVSKTALTSSSNGYKYSLTVPQDNHLQVTLEAQKGNEISVLQKLYTNINMSKSEISTISNTSYITLYVGDIARDATQSTVIMKNTTVTLTNTCTKYYFLGYYSQSGELLSSSSTYDRYVSEDTIIEARFAYYTHFAVSTLIDGTSTYLKNDSDSSTFSYSISYTDPKTGQLTTISNVRNLNKVPSGTVLSIKLNSSKQVASYLFEGIRFVDASGNTLSVKTSNSGTSASSVEISCDTSKVVNTSGLGFSGESNASFTYIAFVYQKISTLTVLKNITLSEADSSDTSVGDEVKNSWFQITVQYTDNNGKERETTLSSVNELSSLKIQKDSSFTIIPKIADSKEQDYNVYDYQFTVAGVSKKNIVTENANGSFTVSTTGFYDSMTFKVWFRPSKALILSKEMAGAPATDKNLTITYSYTDSNGSSIENCVLKDDYSVTIDAKRGGEYSFTANISEDVEAGRYIFLGWYADGQFITKNYTITNQDVRDPHSVVAKFLKVAQLQGIDRLLIDNEGNETDITSDSKYGEVYVTGNFIEYNSETDSYSYKVKTKTLTQLVEEFKTKKHIDFVAGTKLSLATDHTGGVVFKQFRIEAVADQSYTPYCLSNRNADEGTDGHSAITTAIDADIKIHVDFEHAYSLSYLLSTMNADSVTGNGFTLNTKETMFRYTVSSATATIFTFTGTLKEGYSIVGVELNSVKVELNRSGNIYSVTIPTELQKQNLAVKINIAKTVDVSVYIALDGISDASKFGSLNGFAINISEIENNKEVNFNFSEQSFPTSIMGSTNVSAFEKLNVTVTGGTNLTYTHNGITYTFVGFYLYDGSSVSTSVSPITYNSSFDFYASSNIGLVAKFESSKLPVNVSTTVTDTKPADSEFVGWYARVNSTTSGTGYTDILVSTKYEDKNSLLGKFDRLVAKYATYQEDQTLTFAGEYASEGHAIVYTNSTSPLGKNTAITVGENKVTISNIVDGAEFAYSFIANAGYDISTDETTKTCTVTSKSFTVTIKVSSNRVSSHSIDTNETGKLVVKLEETSIKVTVIISVPETTQSTLYANISNGEESTSIQEHVLTSSEKSITLEDIVSGSLVNLYFELAKDEKFSGYKISANGASFIVTDIAYCYQILDTYSEVSIYALFSKATTSTILDTGTNNHGTTSVKDGEDETSILTITADAGYRIKSVEFAEVLSTGNGTTQFGDWENVFEMIPNVFDSDGYSCTTEKSSTDVDGDSYIQKVIVTYKTKANIAINVVYEHVTNATFNVVVDGTTTQTLLKHIYPEDDPLDINKIKSYNLDQKIENSNQNILNYYEYQNSPIGIDTLIDLSSNEISIDMVMSSGYMIKVVIVTRGDYNSPATAIKARYSAGGKSDVVTEYNSTSNAFESTAFKYIKSDNGIISVEGYDYYTFAGYANSALAQRKTSENDIVAFALPVGEYISNYSTKLTLTGDVIENKLFVDGSGNHVVYAIFEEKSQSITISREYEISSPLTITYGLTSLNLNFDALEKDADDQNKTKQYFVDAGENGRFSYQLVKNDTKINVIITYPYSLVDSNDTLLVAETNFEENSTDPLITTGLVTFTNPNQDCFYELMIDNQKYRFDGFYFKGAKGASYSNQYVLSFKDLRSGGSLVAKVIKLYNVQYIYNRQVTDSTKSKIKISIKYTDKNQTELLSSNGALTFNEALISYYVEEGTTLTVYASFDGTGYEDKFRAIFVKDDSEGKLEDLLAGQIAKIEATGNLPTINAYTGWSSLMNSYVSVSQYQNPDAKFNAYRNSDNTSSYSFAVNANMAFIADFTGDGSQYQKTYIYSIMTNITKGNDYSKFSYGTINGTAYTGTGFQFFFGKGDKTGLVYSTSIEHSDNIFKSSVATNQTKVGGETDQNLKKQSEYSNSVSVSSEASHKSVHISFATKFSLEFSTELVLKSSDSITHTEFTDFKNALNESGSGKTGIKITNASGREFSSVETNNKDTGKDNSSEIITKNQSIKQEITISAPALKGYIFKGFAIVSANYTQAYRNYFLLEGDTAFDAYSATQYVFVKHSIEVDQATQKVSRYNATLTLYGSAKVVAVYEPTVYVITVNTYKYYEDNDFGNGDETDKRFETEEKKATEEYTTTDSAIIKGSLLAQHGETIKITSINYTYSQFAGISTTKEMTESGQKIKYAFDTGEGYTVSNLKEALKDRTKATEHIQEYLTGNYPIFASTSIGLTYDMLVPGQLEDGSFVSSSARNNFYAIDVEKDFTVNFFYTNLSYKLKINLTEVESTYDYDTNTSQTYLSYSEEYIRNYEKTYGTWKNPSTGTYNYQLQYGTNSNNANESDDVLSQTKITIEANDRFVYTAVTAGEKTYPTKIANSLVTLAGSNGNNMKLVWKKDGQEIKIITENGTTTFTPRLLENMSDKNDTLIAYGLDYNTPEYRYNVDKDGNKDGTFDPTLRNVFDFVEAVKNEDGTYSYRLKKNLFEIEISEENGTNIITSQKCVLGENLFIDMSNGVIYFEQKIIATENGFPKIKITMKDASGTKNTSSKTDLNSSITKIGIKNITEAEKTNTAQKTAYSISGFNIDQFNDSSQFDDPNFKLENIDVKLWMIWQTTAKPVEAVVEKEDSKQNAMQLTGQTSSTITGSSSVQREVLKCDCDQTNEIFDHNSEEVCSYQIIIIKNGYTLLDMANKFITLSLGADNSDSITKEMKNSIASYFLELMYSPFMSQDGYGQVRAVSSLRQIGNGATGSYMSDVSLLTLWGQMFYMMGYTDQNYPYGEDVAPLISLYNTFTYRVIDAYELYKYGVDRCLYNNAINSNDLVITQCVLNEHYNKQESTSTSTVFGKEIIWEANHAYSYYTNSTTGWSYTLNSGSFSAEYQNFIEETQTESDQTTGSKRSFWESIQGNFNSAKSFSGHYERLLTATLAPCEKDFTSQNIKFKNTVTIKKNRFVSRVFDYNPVPVLDTLNSILAVATVAIIAVGTGGWGGVVIMSLLVVDDMIQIIKPDHKTFSDFVANFTW